MTILRLIKAHNCNDSFYLVIKKLQILSYDYFPEIMNQVVKRVFILNIINILRCMLTLKDTDFFYTVLEIFSAS